MTRAFGEACQSDLRLDRLMVGELDGAAAQKLRAHLASCERCAARNQAMVAAAADLYARRPVLGLPLPARHRRGWFWGLSLGSVAAAVAIVLVMRGPLFAPTRDIRFKGGLALEVFVRRTDGTVQTLSDGDRVSPGDRLRFRVTSPRAGYVAIVSVDPAGEASSYLPPATRLTSLPAGQPVDLAGSAELDDRLGRERLIAVVCADPLETAMVLRATPRELDGLGRCQHVDRVVDKVPPRR